MMFGQIHNTSDTGWMVFRLYIATGHRISYLLTIKSISCMYCIIIKRNADIASLVFVGQITFLRRTKFHNNRDIQSLCNFLKQVDGITLWSRLVILKARSEEHTSELQSP